MRRQEDNAKRSEEQGHREQETLRQVGRRMHGGEAVGFRR